MICEASTIEKITNGAIAAKTLNNWTNRDLWFMPLDDAERGKPRLYTRYHVIEAVIASRLMRAGLTREMVKSAIEGRCISRACGLNGGAAWESDAVDAFKDLPEFDPNNAEAFWIIAQDRDLEGGVVRQGGVIAVQGAKILGEKLAEITEIACVVLNVSQVIRDINAATEEFNAAVRAADDE